jgi:exodeoxyribonuclease VII small subunit
MQESDEKSKVDFSGFEQGLKRLEEIVHLLERGDLELEESIKYFKEGSNLFKKLNSQLSDAEGEIKIVLENFEGNIALADYEH